MAGLLRNAKRPVIVAETSGRDPAAFAALVELADTLAIPAINGRANAYANFPTNHPLYLGMGNYKAVEDADLVLLVGGRAPWYPAQRRPTNGKIVAINDNPLKGHMIYQNLHIDFYLEGDMAEALRLLTAAVKQSKIDADAVRTRRERWTREHESHVAALRAEREKAGNGGAIAPVSLMGTLGDVMPADTIYVDETITHSPVCGSISRRQRRRACSAARATRARDRNGARDQARSTGAAGGAPGRRWLLPLQSHHPGVGSRAEHKPPVVIVVLNNKKYEAMRKGHVHHYPDGASASKNLHYGVTIDGPDYERLGDHFGFHGQRVEKLPELKGALTKAVAATKEGKTSILNVVLTQ